LGCARINGNTIPITAWAIIELVKDPPLLQRLRSEVTETLEYHASSGSRRFNIQKLLSRPLLQSVYTESLRLHVSITITRELLQPITLDGYHLSRGLLQAPTSLSHLEDHIWAREGHSAKEFWADRHIKTSEDVDSCGAMSHKSEFSLASKAGEFFPYGMLPQLA
jgi:hypothetical protein